MARSIWYKHWQKWWIKIYLKNSKALAYTLIGLSQISYCFRVDIILGFSCLPFEATSLQSRMITVHCKQKTPTILFIYNLGKCWSSSKMLSPLERICNKILACSHQLFSYTTLRNLKGHFYHFATTAVTKTYIEIHLFSLNVIHIIWHTLS